MCVLPWFEDALFFFCGQEQRLPPSDLPRRMTGTKQGYPAFHSLILIANHKHQIPSDYVPEGISIEDDISCIGAFFVSFLIPHQQTNTMAKSKLNRVKHDTETTTVVRKFGIK